MSPTLSPEEFETLGKRCWRSRVEFARIFLPDWFPKKMPWVHRGILALLTQRTEFLLDFGVEQWRDETATWTPADLKKILDNFVTADRPGDEETSWTPIFRLNPDTLVIEIKTKANVAVVMPRGFSKTTLINMYDMSEICYAGTDFFLYVSESGAHAERQLGTIRKELAENEAVRLAFGELVPGRQHPNKWTDNYIEPLNKVMVGATGRGGQVRGFSKSAKRPAVIVVDDLEDEDSVLSDTQRAKDHTWLIGTLIPTVRKGGRIFMIGTLLHPDASLARLETSDRFTYVRFGNRDREGQPLWPDMQNEEEIEALKHSMISEGELTAYYLEYESKYVSDATRVFPKEQFERLRIPKVGTTQFIGIALAQDPAISEEERADFCAFGVVGIERGGVKHVLDFYAEKGMDPADQIDMFFTLYFRWMRQVPPEHRVAGIEAIGFQRALVHLVQSEQYKRSEKWGMDAYFPIVPIKHGNVGKVARVNGILRPLFRAGYLTFERKFPILDEQLLSWPTGKRDGPDVIAMAVGLLDPFAALNLGDTGLEDLSKDSAPSLESLGISIGACP